MTARASPEKRARALQLRADGELLRDIAERLGLHVATISRLEHAAGSPRRRKHRTSFADAATGLKAGKRSPLQKG